MKIGVITHAFPRLTETFIRQHVKALIHAGCSVEIYGTSGQGDQNVDTAEFDHVSIHNGNAYHPLCREPTKFFRSLIRSFWRHPFAVSNSIRPSLYGGMSGWSPVAPFQIGSFPTKTRQFDVIHAHFANSGFLASLAKRVGLIDGPIITNFHGFDVSPGRSHRYKRRLQQLFMHGDLYIANSNYTKQRAIDLGCPPDLIRIIPAFVDLQSFQPAEQPVRREKPYKIIAVGRLVEKKGHIYLIRAMDVIQDYFPETVLEIFGDGPLRASLVNAIAELGLQDRVFLRGAAPSTVIENKLRQSDLLVFPSVESSNGDAEGQGVVLQEAQAIGIPIVATRHNGIPDSVVESVTALLVAEKDAQALAYAIRTLLQDPNLRQAMRNRGPEFVREKFSSDKICNDLLNVYREVIR